MPCLDSVGLQNVSLRPKGLLVTNRSRWVVVGIFFLCGNNFNTGLMA